jgi:hypothetical protein
MKMPNIEIAVANNPGSAETQQNARTRLLEEVGNPVVSLLCGNGLTRESVGTGWITADGRIVTSYRTIRNYDELFAEIDGKRHRIGKNTRIDPIANLAVMEFVENTNPVKGLQLHTNAKRQEPVKSTNLTTGAITGMATMEDLHRGQNRRNVRLPLTLDSLNDAMRFVTQDVLKADFETAPSGHGHPVLSDQGVVGMMVAMQGKTGFMVPASRIQSFLDQNAKQSEFIVTSGYESGIQQYFKDWYRAPFRAAADTVLPLGLGTMWLATVASGGRAAPFLALPAIYQTACDYYNLHHSANSTDRTKGQMAVVADSLVLGGAALCAIAPFSRFSGQLLALGGLASAGGLVGRLIPETIPSHYVRQEVRRRDGDSRPPFHPH